jgi:hypothetical protein
VELSICAAVGNILRDRSGEEWAALRDDRHVFADVTELKSWSAITGGSSITAKTRSHEATNV